MTKILVTGGLGLIGHNVVARLQQQGHSVVVTDTRTNYGIIPQAEIDYFLPGKAGHMNHNVKFVTCKQPVNGVVNDVDCMYLPRLNFL